VLLGVLQVATTTQNIVFRFGPYESHAKSLELYKHGTKLKVRPQPLRLLNLMLSRAGKVLTREELRQELWSSETFVDFEHGLNSAVKAVRSALNDSVTEPRYIETIPKVGYRFIAAVEVLSETSGGTVGEQAEAGGAPVRERGFSEAAAGTANGARTSAGRKGWAAILAVGALIAVAAGLGVHWGWMNARPRPNPASGRIILAVLPFQNLSGGTDEDYFSDGLTEELIAQFGRLDPAHLGVIARTSVMHYKHSDEPLDRIGRELGVQYALEGSVRRDANQVRISAQLIQIKDQTRLWSREYDRELSNLLTLQSEIARDIGGEIRVTLGDREPEKSALGAAGSQGSYEAYDLYLRALYFWNKRTPEGFERAVEYFQQSIAKDPTYARAYAGLADTYVLMSGYGGFPPKDLMAKGRAAAQKAVELDDTLAEAHTAKALVAQDFDWDWKTAETEYRRAITLNPNYATAHHWYAEYLALMGRFDEAGVEIEQARVLDPLSLVIATDHGMIFYYARQYDRAIEQLHAVLEMDPTYPRAGRAMDVAYLEKGVSAEALADLKKWQGLADGPAQSENPWFWGNHAYLSGRLGRLEDARHALEKLQMLNREQHVDPIVLALAYLGMNDKNQSLNWLDKAHAEHSVSLTSVNVDPVYDPLRDDARFQALLHAMNLAR
jgi:TolB-like protein/DNA-binding winged helix-turn-helix (wHTH) protein/Flp pilus assembly protein TadD